MTEFVCTFSTFVRSLVLFVCRLFTAILFPQSMIIWERSEVTKIPLNVSSFKQLSISERRNQRLNGAKHLKYDDTAKDCYCQHQTLTPIRLTVDLLWVVCINLLRTLAYLKYDLHSLKEHHIWKEMKKLTRPSKTRYLLVKTGKFDSVQHKHRFPTGY